MLLQLVELAVVTRKHWGTRAWATTVKNTGCGLELNRLNLLEEKESFSDRRMELRMPGICPAPVLRLTLLVMLAGTAWAQTPRIVHVDPSTQWLDSGIDLKSQDQVTFVATGTVNYHNHSSPPAGLVRGWRDLVRALPLNTGGSCALIGRIGPIEAPVFLIGEHAQHTVAVPGRLYLGINRLADDAVSGAGYDVTVRWTSAAATQGNRPVTQKAPATTMATANTGVQASANNALPQSDMVASKAQPAAAGSASTAAATSPTANLPATELKIPDLPLRVSDDKGNDGDMVNLLLVGTKEKVMAAYTAAGWNQADNSVKDALLHGALSSVTKNTYLAVPMSKLVLFGRTQDLGYEHAEAVQVASSRHHLRLWKAPFQLDGSDVWVGAATHDVGFDRDSRNGNVTHKIDPNVDLERNFVRDSLWNSGLIKSATYYTPPKPLTTARTATGEEFHSDGRLLVLSLK